ncbi:hypothetical protein G5I_10747 [Acromyrmex echinatior]|uniref:Uncharacterized protein n=1 Tax=Acromyrmex echinatior TaxID=103372 RepID=F4WXQ7_ACREC|nr:hypothetical protein G5I_10747 [Acromyrmex echinatior]
MSRRSRGEGLDQDFRFMQTRAETPLVTVDFSKTISCTRYTARISSYPGARMCKSIPMVNRKSSGSPRPSSGMSIALHIPPPVICTYIGKLYSRIFAGSEIPMTLSDATDSSMASALSDVTPNPRQRFVSACCNEMRNSSPQLSEDVATLGLAINTSDFFALRAAVVIKGTTIDSYLRVVKPSNSFAIRVRFNLFSPQTKLRQPRRLILDPQVSSHQGCKPENVAAKQRHRYPLYDALRLWGGVDLP